MQRLLAKKLKRYLDNEDTDDVAREIRLNAKQAAFIAGHVPAELPPAAATPAAAPPVVTTFGELEIASPNVLGEVYVNGVAKGWPPIVVKNVPSGKARIEIRVDGTARRNKVVNVPASKRTSVRFN